MENFFTILLVTMCVCSFISVANGKNIKLEADVRYEDNWESLDSRPLPSWYDEAKIGIFIHWGVFSVPSYGSEWFWQDWQEDQLPGHVQFMNENYKPGFTYPEFAPMFTAEFFNPSYWAEVFQASGARYVVLTSKHHEGYTMWPSKYSWNWNVMDVGPKRDLVGELAFAIRNVTGEPLRFGLYHSFFEWFNPLYVADKAANFVSNDFVVTKTTPELYEIVNQYSPDIVWSDGEAEAPDVYWQSTTFLAWLFNDSPVKDYVVVNDRWGTGTQCTHGSFYTCADRYNPGVLQPHKWENCMTLDLKSWGYRRDAVYSDYMSIEELLQTMASTISCGGNLLVNIGPTPEGTIPTIMEERLRQMGQWLSVNGEAIYGSVPWTVQNDTLTSGVWYTSSNVDNTVYAILFEWPSSGVITLGSVSNSENTTVTLLGDSLSRSLQISPGPIGLEVTFPPRSEVVNDWLWTLKMEHVLPVK